MAVIRLTSKKSLPILLQALKVLRFSQTELAQHTSTSIGRVNKLITWLKERGILTKEQGKYVITQPNRLAEMIADQSSLMKARTYFVQISPQDILETDALIPCGKTALAKQTNQEPQEFLFINTIQARNFLDHLPRGELTVTVYDTDEEEYFTHPVKTIIECKILGDNQIAEQAALDLWGTRQ